MNKEIFKKILPYLAALAIFIILTLVYASPALDGKVINAGDTKSWEGMYQEGKEYVDSGHHSWWTGSMFSGMPNYQIGGGQYPAPAVDVNFRNMAQLWFPATLAFILAYFLGYFILLRSFKINEWLSIVGAIAIAMSSYFFLIIPAGHNTKAMALGFLPVIIGGFHLIFQKKYGWGIILTMVYSSFALMLHPQMTYYIFMIIGLLAIAELYIHIREKRWKDLGIGVAAFALAFGIGFGVQSTGYMVNKEYAKETMRGGHSEIAKEEDAVNKTSGLSLEYMTDYSYGIGETSTLLIPGSRGYASYYDVGTNSKVYDALVKEYGLQKRDAANVCKITPTYWGGDEGTSGPVYVGAIVCFLFVLGLLIVKGPYKWALLVATIFSILLSWGSNFMWLTELFAKYFPMYTKFRAVESILVVAEITIPLLGFLALKEVMDQKAADTYDKKKMLRNIYIAAGVTAGLCLVAIFASFFINYDRGEIDAAIFERLKQNHLHFVDEEYYAAVFAERAAIYRASAFRSLLFVLLGAASVWLYASEKLKFGYFVAILGVLILVDMWAIDRKFFNDDNFVNAKQDKEYFAEQPWEKEILDQEGENGTHNFPTNKSYRIFNLTNPQGAFNDSRTSYRFKSIGGYHAAKLRRYQDLIDAHISSTKEDIKEDILMRKSILTMDGQKYFLPLSDTTDYPVLNMLNMKYAVVDNGQPIVVANPNAFGNAWFVDSVKLANNPNEESDALGKINLRNTLVTDVQFKDFVKDFQPGHDSTAQIKLTKYAPDYVEYDYRAAKDGTVVFSEIYYPYGWKAYIDDKPADHFRANYTLRAMNVPAGQHHIRFEFRPDTVEKWGKVSVACKYLIYLTILGIAGFGIFRMVRRRKVTKA